jgi:hypothetical protein
LPLLAAVAEAAAQKRPIGDAGEAGDKRGVHDRGLTEGDPLGYSSGLRGRNI